MTVKEQLRDELDALQHEISGLDDSQAAVALALVKTARNGTELVDIYGTPWGAIRPASGVLKRKRTGPPTIEIPPGIPHLP
jgi:hypothetical protein